ncbi:MAG: DMT family transporter [Hyphomicrobiaceae bacterium]
MNTPSPLLLRVAPVIFVGLWSTGWIVARAITPYADPLTYLSARFALAAVVLLVFAFASGARWPSTGREFAHMILSGVLSVGVYFAGVWYAIGHGVPAGISGLIAALQPLLTALLAPMFLNERISALQWCGIMLSTAGITLVLQPKLAGVAPADLAQIWGALGINALGMVAFTIASIHQKKYLAHSDIRALTPIQMLSGLAAILPFAILTEQMRLEWNAVTIGAMVWSVLVLSIGAGALYVTMIRAGAVSKVAALIYLVPLTVAIEAYFLFGETMTPLQIAGMLVTSAGVALAMKRG